MKLLSTFLFNLLLLGGLTLSTCNKAKASELPEAKKMKAINTEIKGKIAFPEELLEQSIQEKVTVEFKIRDDKSIEVVSVQSDNSFLKSNVKKQMEKMQLQNTEGFIGKTLEISILFAN